MSSERNYHIILLPEDNYWEWVQAVRDYAVRFQVSVTPLPANAVRFHRPEQTVTVVDAPGAYPEQGDIIAWFGENAPEIPLDVIEVSTPHQLRNELSVRVVSRERFGGAEIKPAASPESLPIRLHWPTDYPVITQEFGDNPHLYRRWGLPGHEGVDIRAPLNSKIYACADGLVYRIHNGTGGHPYGIHVRIMHAGGYKTVYAHLNQALVRTQQMVRAGDVIGLADSTGNSSGSHLHLTLKKDGATEAGLTPYTNDIIDPTPYLIPRERTPQQLLPESWPRDRCLVGVAGRVGAPMEEADWNVVRNARVEALKFAQSVPTVDVVRARQVNTDMLILVQLTADFSRRPLRPAEFVDLVEGDLWRLYSQGVRYFEIHNAPNVIVEGYGSSWRDGHEFGQWFLEVVGLLRLRYPEAKFGWPGLSPGGTTSGIRYDYRAFLKSAEGAVRHADWLGCHCYWETESEMFDEEGGQGYQVYLDEWPDKLLMITEFSNPSAEVSPHLKGSQYMQYYRQLLSEPGIGAAFAFALSSPGAHNTGEVWRGENGWPTPIVTAVASRPF